jgi:antitoxin CptB
VKKKNNHLIELENKRLKWACRRGMLELDVLLSNFLTDQYFKLKKEEKSYFIILLDCSDPEIFSWLLGHEEPEDQGLKNITKVIREHARSRISS